MKIIGDKVEDEIKLIRNKDECVGETITLSGHVFQMMKVVAPNEIEDKETSKKNTERHYKL